ncbi:MAG: chemotaxis protein CheA [bacterium]
MSSEDIEEFELQLDIITGVLEKLDATNTRVFEVVKDMFTKIVNLPTVSEKAGLEARQAAGLADMIYSGESSFEDEYPSILSAALKLGVIISNEKNSEGRQTRQVEAQDEYKDINREEILFNFIERQTLALEELESNIMRLERGDFSALADVLNNVTSIKGEAAALNLERVNRLLGEIETRLKHTVDIPEHNILTALLSAKDFLTEYISGLPDSESAFDENVFEKLVADFGGGSKGEDSCPAPEEELIIAPVVHVDASNPEMPEFVNEAKESLHIAEVALIALEKEPDNAKHINEIFRGFHNIKGVAGFLYLTDVSEISHNAESLLDKARQGEIKLEGPVAAAAFSALDILKEMVERVQRALAGTPYKTPSNYADVLRNLRNPGAAASKPAVKSITAAATAPTAESAAQNDPSKLKSYGLIKVSTARLDSLIDAVGELVIANAMVTQEREIRETSNPKLVQNVAHLGKITRELQELAMSMRMVTLKSAFQKMSRIARDVAVRSCTPVEFTYSGEETELDRNVVEEISSPLVHLVRNAVDHGIETAEERIRLGKPEKGRVHLSAYHESGNVVIKIEDDGKGLDKKQILAKAISQGLVKNDAELSDREIYNLVFLPGFSTAKTVTDVSGRGVGMDVVRKSIENLRGRIDIESEQDRGASFTIRLPLTLAIIDGMLMSVGEERYIIPTIAIRESLRPEAGQITTVVNRGELLSIRGELLPLFRLHKLFGVKNAKQNPNDALALIIGESDAHCALMVDDLIGQQQVVIKTLGKSFGHIEGITGGAIMGDGRVALILDTAGLVHLAHNNTDQK